MVLSSFALTVSSYAQNCKSISVDASASCANMVVEIRGVTSGRLEGQINPRVGLPIVVTVYRASKANKKRSAYSAADETSPVVSFEADENGRFCYPALPEGYYVVKFGTYSGAWNCTWMKLHIVSGAPVVKVKTDLTLGT